jgi:putative membrane protein
MSGQAHFSLPILATFSKTCPAGPVVGTPVVRYKSCIQSFRASRPRDLTTAADLAGKGGAMPLLSYWDDWTSIWGGGLWLLLPLMMVLCIIGVFLCSRMCCGRVWVPGDRDGDRRLGETPLDIAKRRYAQGEITKEQYEEIKRTLR